MGLVIKSNVDQIQSQYVDVVTKYFMNKDFPYDYKNANTTAIKIYNEMIVKINDLINPKNINTTFSTFPNFYKGYPILTFKSSKGSSTWYFAHIKNENNNVVVFDMKNVNDNKGRTFIHDEVQKSLDFMQRLLEIKI